MGTELMMSDHSFRRDSHLRESLRSQELKREEIPYNRPTHSYQQQSASQATGDNQVQTFAGSAIVISSTIIAEHVLSHPCIVLRRQCQVHHNAEWHHLTPFTLFHVLLNLHRTQGLGTLWKGLGSVFLSKGILMVSENVISEFTPLPKEVSRHNSLKKHGEHLLLKGLACILTTPFLAASLIETVQADVSSERPGLLDCLKEGVTRVMGWGMPQTTRLQPIYKLILPTALFGISHYIIVQMAHYTVISTIKLEEQESRENSSPVDSRSAAKSFYETHFPEMLGNFTGNLLADMMLYPFETVIHRLYLQGTRTIIDNTDTGLDVIPINTRYEGLLDCFKSIILDEGLSGLYKGFGALILQYLIYAAILRTAKYLFEKLTNEYSPRRPVHSVPT